MKNLHPTSRIATICIGIFLLTSCKKDESYVVFRNNSVTNSTYNVVWDGNVITTLSPFTSSEKFTVEPGSHTLVFKKSNTGLNACSQSTPSLSKEESVELSCGG
ncbi:MAG: hypothetical protein WAU70_17950 [Flavobacteriales bacterium]